MSSGINRPSEARARELYSRLIPRQQVHSRPVTRGPAIARSRSQQHSPKKVTRVKLMPLTELRSPDVSSGCPDATTDFDTTASKSPFDFIEYAKKKGAEDEFVYLKASNVLEDAAIPTNLEIITASEAQREEFWTLSLRGLTHVRGATVDFIPLKDWIRTNELFSKVMSIPFFKNQRQWRHFRLWKAHVQRSKMQTARQALSDDLFFSHPILRPAFIKVQRELNNSLQIRLFHVRSDALYSLDSFLKENAIHRDSVIRQFDLLHSRISSIVQDACERTKEALSSGESYNDGRRLEFTRKASFRAVCIKLLRFVRLVDFLVISTLRSICLLSLMELLATFSSLHSRTSRPIAPPTLPPELSKIYASMRQKAPDIYDSPVFRSDLSFDETVIVSPTENELKDKLETIRVDAVDALFKFPRLIADPVFRPFLMADERLSSPDLGQIVFGDPVFKSCCTRLLELVSSAFLSLGDFAALFEPSILASKRQLDMSVDSESTFRSSAEQISLDEDTIRKSPDREDVGIFRVVCTTLKASLLEGPAAAMRQLKIKVPLSLSRRLAELDQLVGGFARDLAGFGQDVSSLVAFLRSASLFEKQATEIKEGLREALGIHQLASQIGAQVSPDDYSLLQNLPARLEAVALAASSASTAKSAGQVRCEPALRSLLQSLQSRIESVEEALKDERLDSAETSCQEAAKMLVVITAKADETVEGAIELEEYHQELGIPFPRTVKAQALNIQSECDARRTLWESRAILQGKREEWLQTPLEAADPRQLAADTENIGKLPDRAQRTTLGGLVASELSELRSLAPVIAALQSLITRVSHREQVESLLGLQLSGVTVGNLAEVHAHHYSKEISAAAARASHESKIEEELNEARQKLESLSLSLSRGKKIEGGNVKEGLEEVSGMLSAIRASPFVAPLRTAAEDLTKLVRQARRTLDALVGLQTDLLAVSSAGEVRLRADEARALSSAERTVKAIAIRIAEDGSIVRLSAATQLVGDAEAARSGLVNVKTALLLSLQSKRSAFPRLFLLTDDELLRFASVSRDPRSVKPFLGKLFAGLTDIELVSDGGAPAAVSVMNTSGERLAIRPVKFRGAADTWLQAVDEAIRRAMRGEVRTARANRAGASRSEWSNRGISQVAALSARIEWCERISVAIAAPNPARELSALMSEISEVNEGIREEVMAVDIEMRDVLQRVSKTHSWSDEIRFEWDMSSNDVVIKRGSASTGYGYELLPARTLAGFFDPSVAAAVIGQGRVSVSGKFSREILEAACAAVGRMSIFTSKVPNGVDPIGAVFICPGSEWAGDTGSCKVIGIGEGYGRGSLRPVITNPIPTQKAAEVIMSLCNWPDTTGIAQKVAFVLDACGKSATSAIAVIKLAAQSANREAEVPRALETILLSSCDRKETARVREIIIDTFSEIPPINEADLRDICCEMGLNDVQKAVLRASTIRDTLSVYRTLVVYGPPGSGKTASIALAAKAARKNIRPIFGFTSGFNGFIPRQGEWVLSDSIALPEVACQVALSNSPEWDGKVLFETVDLSFADPSIIGRIGIVYIESKVSDWRTIAYTEREWVCQSLPEPLANRLRELTDATLHGAVEFLREFQIDNPLPSIQSLFRIFVATFLTPEERAIYEAKGVFIEGRSALSTGIGDSSEVHRCTTNVIGRDEALPDPDSYLNMNPPNSMESNSPRLLAEREDELKKRFAFALVWGFGGGLDSSSRLPFSSLTRDLLSPFVPLPVRGLLFDWFISPGSFEWAAFSDNIQKFFTTADDDFASRPHKIYVPTVETVRIETVIRALSLCHYPVHVTGPSGSGKSMIIRQSLPSKPAVLPLTKKQTPEEVFKMLSSYPAHTSVVFDDLDTSLPLSTRDALWRLGSSPPRGTFYIFTGTQHSITRLSRHLTRIEVSPPDGASTFLIAHSVLQLCLRPQALAARIAASVQTLYDVSLNHGFSFKSIARAVFALAQAAQVPLSEKEAEEKWHFEVTRVLKGSLFPTPLKKFEEVLLKKAKIPILPIPSPSVSIKETLSVPNSHVLVIGCPGSGRKAAAKSAAVSLGYDIIEAGAGFSFRDDLRNAAKKCGISGKGSVLIVDHPMRYQSVIEDVTKVVSGGGFMSLYSENERDAIISEVASLARSLGEGESYGGLTNLFDDRASDNLHIVVILESGSNILTDYSSLTRHCQVVVVPSPELRAEPEVMSEIFQMASVPYSLFPHFITSYNSSIERQITAYGAELGRLNGALDKLKVIRKETQLATDALAKTEQLMKETEEGAANVQHEDDETLRLKIESADRETIEYRRQAETLIASEKSALSKVEPVLTRAAAFVGSLTRGDIKELTVMSEPPSYAKAAAEAASVLLGGEPTWRSAQSVLMDPLFTSRVSSLSSSRVPAQLISKADAIIAGVTFPSEGTSSGTAARLIFDWVSALVLKEKTLIKLEPSRKEIERLEALAREGEEKSKRAQDMRRIASDARERQKELEGEKERRRQQLKENAATQQRRITSGEAMLSALSSEEQRWANRTKAVETEKTFIVGRAIIEAALVSLLGVYLPEKRQRMIKDMITKVEASGYHVGEGYSPSFYLRKPIYETILDNPELREDIELNDPDEDLKAIIEFSPTAPFVTDPQGKGIKWLRDNVGGGLVVLKPSQAGFLRSVETASRAGNPVIIEDAGMSIESALDPLLPRAAAKLCFVTKLPFNSVEPSVREKATVVNWEPDPLRVTWKAMIKLVPDTGFSESALTQTRRKLVAEENRLLEHVQSATSAALDDGILAEALVSMCQTAEETRKELIQLVNRKKELQAQRRSKLNLAVAYSTALFSARSLSVLSPFYEFPPRIFEAALSGEDPKSIVRAVTEIALPRVSTEHRDLFMLVLALTLYEGSEKDFILHGITPMDNPFENPLPEFLPDRAWSEINAAGRYLTSLRNLPGSIMGNSEGYRNFLVGSSDIPEANLGPCARLLVFKIMKPSQFVIESRRFVSETLGDVIEHPVSVESNRFLIVSQTTLPGIDFVEALSRGNKVRYVPAHSPTFQLNLAEARQRGEWIVSIGASLEIVRELSGNISTNPSFKSVILTEPFTIPFDILRRADIFAVQRRSSLRVVYNEAIEYLGKTGKAAKVTCMTYAICQCLPLLSSRHFTTSPGFLNEDLNVAYNSACYYAKDDDDEGMIRELSNVLFGSRFPLHHDKLVLASLVSSLLAPDFDFDAFCKQYETPDEVVSENMSDKLLDDIYECYGSNSTFTEDTITEYLSSIVQVDDISSQTDEALATFSDPLTSVLKSENEALKSYITFVKSDASRSEITRGKIPKEWRKYVGPVYIEPWIRDLNLRVDFFNTWVRRSRPASFALGCFTNPRGFLTAVLQRYARASQFPIQRLSFSVRPVQNEPTDPSEEGIVLQGIRVVGARWDHKESVFKPLEEGKIVSDPLFVKLLPVADIPEEKKICSIFERLLAPQMTANEDNYITSVSVPEDSQFERFLCEGISFICQNI